MHFAVLIRRNFISTLYFFTIKSVSEQIEFVLVPACQEFPALAPVQLEYFFIYSILKNPNLS
jgi:hypothetical protein